MTPTAPPRDLADHLLATDLPRRWNHTEGVAVRAGIYARVLGLDADTCEAAAWLHDIGYAPQVARTGFPPLDGARHLRDLGHPAIVCELVAHQAASLAEAQERGLAEALVEEFGPPQRHADLLAVLTTGEMTTLPDGGMVDVETRICELLSGDVADGPAHRALTRSAAALIETTNGVLKAVHRAAGR